ncbi:WD40-repeat-containing domain protein, partial [Earliella scabrosa]
TALVEFHHLNKGHSDTVNTLQFSSDGVHLASGGDDRTLIIWNAQEGRLLYRVLFQSNVDCVLWHPGRSGTLIVGCESGYMFQLYDFTQKNTQRYEIQLGVLSTIHCMAYDKQSSSLAVGVGSDVYTTRETRHSEDFYEGAVMYPPPSLNADSAPDRDDRLRPVGIHFLGEGDLLVASYLAHGIRCWDTNNQNVVWHIMPPQGYPSIGSSSLSPDSRLLATYNVVNGVHLYSITNFRKRPRQPTLLRLTNPRKTTHSVQLGFTNGSSSLVCGTTTGDVHVWNVTTSDLFQVLGHGSKCLYVSDRGDHAYIATGSTDKGQSTYIKIWRARIS